MPARRAQRPITIRSDRAVARLALLTRDGRSQAQVIEEAREAMPEPGGVEDGAQAALLARLDAVSAQLRKSRPAPSMADFDAREYDERGNPR